MIKNWKSGLLWGFLLWIFIFVEWSILMFLPWVKDKQVVQYLIHFVVLVILVMLCAGKYFKNVSASAKEGFVVGIFFLIIGNVLDMVITIPLFIGGNYGAFYGNWMMWFGFLIMILTSTFVGMKKAGCTSCTSSASSVSSTSSVSSAEPKKMIDFPSPAVGKVEFKPVSATPSKKVVPKAAVKKKSAKATKPTKATKPAKIANQDVPAEKKAVKSALKKKPASMKKKAAKKSRKR
ncbi:MAG: hypothetical protein ABIG89_03325 [Candidatus Woesearchaeota archaeon]